MTAEEELLKLEKVFAEAIVKNDLEGIGRLVADDWIIIDPDGKIVEQARFFEVIKSGALTMLVQASNVRGAVTLFPRVENSNIAPIGNRKNAPSSDRPPITCPLPGRSRLSRRVAR